MPVESQEMLLLGYVVTVVVLLVTFLWLRKKKAAAQREAEGANIDGQPIDADDADIDDAERKRREEMRKLLAETDHGKLTKAQRRKLEKAQRKHDNAMAKKIQEEKEKKKAEKQNKYEAKLAERRAKREEEEEKRLEAEKKAQEEKKRQEDEEFDEWAHLFEVKQTGSQAEEANLESQGLLGEFIDYIKNNKVVTLDDVAGEFGLKTKDVVKRIKALEQSGRISGVLDDRGKFIFITESEYDAVAKFIQRKGRVNIQDIVAESNKLIDLNPNEAALSSSTLDDDDDDDDDE